MGFTIYIWIGKGIKTTGHASLTLSNGTHISWWPGVQKGKKDAMTHVTAVPASVANYYEEDVVLMNGRQADHVHVIDVNILNENVIRNWWENYKVSKEFHLLTNNCCSVVYEALRKGGADHYASFPYNPISYPSSLHDYAKTLKQCAEEVPALQQPFI